MSAAKAEPQAAAELGLAVADGAAQPEEEEEELDEESKMLLRELEESQAEVHRMLDSQRQQATELGGMKDHLASELQQLQDEAWKLQVFAELEMLKRQLAAINNLDADLDQLEEKLESAGTDKEDDFEGELAAARAETTHMLERLAGGPGAFARDVLAEGAEGGPSGSSAAAVGQAVGAAAAAGDPDAAVMEDAAEDVKALQDELDAELATMYKQLQAIKAESAMVAARKAHLELELMTLIREGADELTSQLAEMNVQEGEGEAEAEAVEGKPAAAEAAAEGA